MINLKLTFKRDMVPRTLKRLKRDLENFPQEMLDKFIELTPKDTGYARKNTRLVGKKRIIARYKYASVLDAGRRNTAQGPKGSKQAPEGMTKPLKAWVKTRIRQIKRKGRI